MNQSVVIATLLKVPFFSCEERTGVCIFLRSFHFKSRSYLVGPFGSYPDLKCPSQKKNHAACGRPFSHWLVLIHYALPLDSTINEATRP